MEVAQEHPPQLVPENFEDGDLHEKEIEGFGSEEEYETDEEVDKRQFGIYQALPVDDAEPDWESGEPETVEEYLRRVRYEARHLPSVVTSSVDPRQFDDRQTSGYAHLDAIESEVADCPLELRPSVGWVQQFLKAFAELRQRLQREHEATTGQVQGQPLHVAIPPTTSATAGEQTEPSLSTAASALMPELVLLRGLDQVTLVSRLQKAVHHITAAPELTPGDAAQVYALSARIELPLHADTAAAYRALLRKCRELRAGVTGSQDPLLPHLNVLIVLAGGFFRQDEELSALWEDDEDFQVL